MRPDWRAPESEESRGLYSWGGFAIESNAHLPRLHPASGPPDTSFVWRGGRPPAPPAVVKPGTVVTRDGAAIRFARGGDERRLHFHVDEVGTYEVHGLDRRIEFFAVPGADPMRIEHILVNNVLPTYAGLRSVVCLHAAAVARDGRALVFAGGTGAGKSTTALRYLDDGWSLLADDATVLRREDRWLVYPGARTLRLEGLTVSGAWNNRGKAETFVPTEQQPVALERIVLLAGQSRPAALPERRPPLVPTLCALQSGWPWAGPAVRNRLSELTADLVESLGWDARV